RSQLLAVCVLVLLVVFSCVDTLLTVLVPHYQPPWYGYVLMVATFTLNRIGLYRVAAPLLIAMFPAVVFGFVFIGDGPPSVCLSMLVLSRIVAAISLPIWGVAVLVLVNVCGIALAPLIEPGLGLDATTMIGSMAINAMTGILAMLYMHHRNGLEADR